MKIDLSKIKNILNTKIDTVGDGLTKTNTTVRADIGNSSNTSSTKLVACNDSRLSDARTPTPHNHNLTNVEHTSIELVTVTYTDDSTRTFQLVSYNDTSLPIRVDKKIIQTSGTVTITALLLDDNNTPLSGKTVQLYKGSNTLVGTMTDNSDGTYSYTYTGTGAGLTKFYGKYGNIQSETYEIIDGIFYDDGVTSPKPVNWYKATNTLEVSIDNTGTLVSCTEATNYYANSTSSINRFIETNFGLEFDIVSFSGDFGVRIRTTSNTDLALQDKVSNGSHVKITFNDGVLSYSIDGGTPQSQSTSISGSMGVSFRLGSGTNSVKYKNFVIYPI